MMLHNCIYPSAGNSVKSSSFSIYVLSFLLFCIYEKCLSLSLKDFIISLQGEIFESSVQNVHACLITHKNPLLQTEGWRSDMQFHILSLSQDFCCSMVGYQKPNIVPVGIIDRTELTLSIELAFLMIRSEKNPTHIYIYILNYIYTSTFTFMGRC